MLLPEQLSVVGELLDEVLVFKHFLAEIMNLDESVYRAVRPAT